jgi:Na+/H+ antiporter NhaD/arsenite permease-like protein
MGEIMVKWAKGAKVKIFIQILHMTCVITALVYNLKLCILDTPFNIAF